jgi:predicted amidohydrolase
MGMVNGIVDDVDRALIAELQRDAGQAYALLGRAVGLSAGAAHDRVRKLRERGVIRRTTVEVDPAALGRGVLAFVMVDSSAWMGEASDGRSISTASRGRRVHRPHRHRRPARQRRGGPAPGPPMRAGGVAVAVFPELCLSGYSIEDLLLQDALLDEVEAALQTWWPGRRTCCRCWSSAPRCATAPDLQLRGVVHRGRILGVAPKSYLPNYREFYERRQIAAGDDERGGTIRVGGETVPFGTDLLFAAEDVPGLVLHAEICEDMWVPVPPSAEAALAGATVLVNLSGSPITVGRAEDRGCCAALGVRPLPRRLRLRGGRLGESTTDLSWDGQTMIYENGELLAETDRFPLDDQYAVADIDLDLLRQERQRMGTFDDNRRTHAARTSGFRSVSFGSTRRSATSDCAPGRALPVRAGRRGAPRAGLLRGVQHPGRGVCSSGWRRSAARRSSSGCPAASTPRTR